MILACPNCSTRFVVDDRALAAGAGRRLRCAGCGHIWRYAPDTAIAGAAVEAARGEPETAGAGSSIRPRLVAAAAPEDAPASAAPAQSRPAPRTRLQGLVAEQRPSISAVPPAPARRPGNRAALLGVSLVAAVFVLVAVLARDEVLALWPSSAPVYAALHLAEPPGAGLEVTVTPTRTSDSVVINGNILNGAHSMRAIPRLRVTLRDSAKNDLESRVITAPVNRLEPGATTQFTTVFEHPSITATGVEVTFAAD
jgi:predicted Zn finger-like uncharacterized protein